MPAPAAATAFDDPFGAFMSSSSTVTSSVSTVTPQQQPQPQQLANSTAQQNAAVPQSNENLLGGLGDLNAAMSNGGDASGAITEATPDDGKKSKESILALFGNTSQQQQQQQQMYGVPGE